MDLTIRFVGGPADGQTLTIPNTSPPPLYFIPLAPSITELTDTSLEISPTKKAEYVPQLQDGLFQLGEDGAYLYRHRAVPLSSEERDALAHKRAEAREAEARRTAEADVAWQEIRKERPGYPEDWRDLF